MSMSAGQQTTCSFTLKDIHSCDCGVCGPLRRMIGVGKKQRVRKQKSEIKEPAVLSGQDAALPPGDRD